MRKFLIALAILLSSSSVFGVELVNIFDYVKPENITKYDIVSPDGRYLIRNCQKYQFSRRTNLVSCPPIVEIVDKKTNEKKLFFISKYVFDPSFPSHLPTKKYIADISNSYAFFTTFLPHPSEGEINININDRLAYTADFRGSTAISLPLSEFFSDNFENQNVTVIRLNEENSLTYQCQRVKSIGDYFYVFCGEPITTGQQISPMIRGEELKPVIQEHYNMSAFALKLSPDSYKIRDKIPLNFIWCGDYNIINLNFDQSTVDLRKEDLGAFTGHDIYYTFHANFDPKTKAIWWSGWDF